MYLIFSRESLALHHLSIFIVLLIFSIVFIGAALAAKGEDEPNDGMGWVTAFLFLALALDRFLILVGYGLVFSGSQAVEVPAWLLLRHTALLLLEVALYGLVWNILREPVKKWLKNRLRNWLDS